MDVLIGQFGVLVKIKITVFPLHSHPPGLNQKNLVSNQSHFLIPKLWQIHCTFEDIAENIPISGMQIGNFLFMYLNNSFIPVRVHNKEGPRFKYPQK